MRGQGDYRRHTHRRPFLLPILTIMFKLKVAERSALRAETHALNPIVFIGEAGLTDGVLKEIDAYLDVQALIKVRMFGDEREERLAIYETIYEKLGAASVQHIGKLLVLLSSKERGGKDTQQNTRKEPCAEITVAKHSPSETKRPTRLPKSYSRATSASLRVGRSNAQSRVRVVRRNRRWNVDAV